MVIYVTNEEFRSYRSYNYDAIGSDVLGVDWASYMSSFSVSKTIASFLIQGRGGGSKNLLLLFLRPIFELCMSFSEFPIASSALVSVKNSERPIAVLVYKWKILQQTRKNLSRVSIKEEIISD
jgi:hypothetical protein